MKCSQCQQDFKPGERIFITDQYVEVHVCGKECCNGYDESRDPQMTMLPKNHWKPANFGVHILTIDGATLIKAEMDLRETSPVMRMGVTLPGDLSADDLKAFSGETISIDIKREEITPEKMGKQEKVEPEKAADKKKADGKKAEPKNDPLAKLLIGSLHQTTETEGNNPEDIFWKHAIEKGIDDAELVTRINLQWHISGIFSIENFPHKITFKAGKSPKVWLDDAPVNGKPTLEGRALLAKVRDLLGIARPKGAK